ncbi:MAG TPA: 6-bladed beta-propeller [Gemmatimonadaceae bacterium]|nr:6-bladed beta-propeller [Gemmatimonadaceae bacterium]
MAALGSGLTEDLRIGTVDGDERLQFLRIRAVSVDPANGDVYVANAGSYSIRVFTARGAFVREIGRRGDGPGEFQSIVSLRIVADTIVVWDFSLRRVTAFRLDGALLATWPTVSPTSGRDDAAPIASVPGGWLVSNSMRTEGRWTPGMHVIYSTVVRRTPAAAPSQSVADLTGDTVVVLPNRESIAIQTPIFVSAGSPLFAPSAAFGVDAKGNVFVHRGAPYEITVHDARGNVVRRIAPPHAPRAVTPQLIDEFRKRAKAYHDTVSNKGGEYAASYAVDMARPGLKSPATLPPLGRMLIAGDGAVWVERIDLVRDPVAREWSRGPAPATPTTWDRFNAAGAPQRPVELPPRFSPMFATASTVLGVQRDEDGVEFVVRYVVRQ